MEINRLQQYTLCVTNSPGVFYSCKRLYPETKYLKFGLGFHPKAEKSELRFSQFKSCFNDASYIGEVGLDFLRVSKEEQILQLKRFEELLKFCCGSGKPMSIHIRGAYKQAIELLNKYPSKQYIVHWFTGTREDLRMLVAANCYFSINEHMLTDGFLSVIQEIPINKILIESDGPFGKLQNKKYEPQKLRELYDLVEKRINVPDLKERIFANFKQLLQENKRQ